MVAKKKNFNSISTYLELDSHDIKYSYLIQIIFK